jgi:hypothetical protein
MPITTHANEIDTKNMNELFKPVKEGYYHFQFEGCEESEQEEYLKFLFKIVGTEPDKQDQFGKNHNERIYYKEKQLPYATKKYAALAVALGATQISEIEQCKKNNIAITFGADNPGVDSNSIAIWFNDFIGKTFVGKLSEQKDKDGNISKYLTINADFFPLTSSEAEKVVLNQNFIDNINADVVGGIAF